MDIHRNGTWRSLVIAATFVMVGSALAAYYVPPPCSGGVRCSPGFQFGRSHCGSTPTTGGLKSRESCNSCCRNASKLNIGGPQIHPGQVGNCNRFCEQVSPFIWA